MNITKHLDFFDPINVKEEIHVIGIGATGSNIAVQLARIGASKIHLWDFDTVDEHNITNQTYTTEDIGLLKIDALKKYLLKINPNIELMTHKKYTIQPLKGYIFMCIDSIEQRYKIYNNLKFNRMIKTIIETRIGLDSGQVLITNWSNITQIDNHISMSNFSDKDHDVPISACGTTLSISPSILICTAYAISAFINIIKEIETPKQVHFNAFNYTTVKFK